MTAFALSCQTNLRRQVLRVINQSGGASRWNGIDFAQRCATCPNTVEVALLCTDVNKTNYTFILRGGSPEQTQTLTATWHSGNELLELKVNRPLTTGTYEVTLVGDFVDPLHASATFAVHGGSGAGLEARRRRCGVPTIHDGNITEIDPRPARECEPRTAPAPTLDYLARDFQSLRQMLLDRLSVLQPEWKERHLPDFGIACVELFAYVGDLLSYQQDAVATEAYLGTSRMRISVRRHARLVDYSVHEGCNARTWAQIAVDSPVELDPRDVFLIPRIDDDRLRDRPSIARDDIRDYPDSLQFAFEIVAVPKWSRLTQSSVKDWFGLAASLFDGSHLFSELLLSLLPKPLVDALKSLVSGPSPAAFPCDLKESLTKELREVIEQHSLWLRPEFHSLRSHASAFRMALPGRDRSPAVCNLALLHCAAPQVFADPGDSDRVRLYPDLNAMRFYTWDQEECCLPIGATSATLLDSVLLDPADQYSPRTSSCSTQVARHLDERRLKHLSIGDVLIFEEIKGPRTGVPYDADPNHRHAVRLTGINYTFDPVHGTPIVEIEWHADDALPFPLCVSSRATSGDCSLIHDVSVARGNVVLVDHGLTTRENWLGVVSDNVTVRKACPTGACSDSVSTAQPRRAGLNPILEDPDLTFADSVSKDASARRIIGSRLVSDATPAMHVVGIPARPATGALADAEAWDRAILRPRDLEEPDQLIARLLGLSEPDFRRVQGLVGGDAAVALDDLRLSASTGGAVRSLSNAAVRSIVEAFHWDVRSHLLDSGPLDRHLVVEMDNERRAHLRFGDGEMGRRPVMGEAFWATYRTGNGPRGNLGAESLGHLVSRSGVRNGAVLSIRNPLPAAGGQAPESIDHVKLHAPHAFERPMRAIVADDYPKLVLRKFPEEIQACRAVLLWTGVCYRACVTIDPRANVRDRSTLVRDVRTYLEQVRRINHEVQVELPVYVGLDIAITICVQDGFLRAHVRRDLLEALGNGVLSNGRRGFFHPDNLSFGSPIYLSRLVRQAREVAGVENVEVTRLQRFGLSDQGELDRGVVTFGPFEIPRLDNDIRRPACGVLCLDMRGRA